MTAPVGSLTLAKGRRKIGLVSALPANWQALDPADIIDLTSIVARSDFTLGFTDSDKVDDAPLDAVSNQQALDADNFEGGFNLYRYLNEGGVAGSNDTAWPILSTKGNSVFVIEREEPMALASVDWTADDIGVVFPFTVDNPGWPNDLTGYLKRAIRLNPNGDATHFKIAAGS